MRHLSPFFLLLFLVASATAQTIRIDVNYYANYASECGDCNGGPENYIRSRVRLGGSYSGNFESNGVGCGWSGSGCSGGSVGGSNAADWTGQSYYSTVYMQTWGYEDDGGVICGGHDGDCGAGDAGSVYMPSYTSGYWYCWEAGRGCSSDGTTIYWHGRYGFRWTWEYLDPGSITGATTICAETTATISNSGLGTNDDGGNHGTSFQWQSSPTGTGSWSDISGATGSSYTTTALTSTTYYRRAIVGNVNFVAGSRAYTGVIQITVTPRPTGHDQYAPINLGTIGCASTYSNTQNNATSNCFGNYAGQSSDDIWYQFTISQTHTVEVSTCSSGFDTYVHIANSSGTILYSNDDNGPLCAGSRASLRQSLAAGTYFVIAEGYSTGSGSITTQINIPRPTGNYYTSPIVAGTLSCGSTYTATNNNSTGNCFGNNTGQASDDIWYQFTLTNDAYVDVSTCSSSFDTYVHIANSSGTTIYFNDDNGPICAGTTASIRQLLSAGTYYAVTEGYSTNSGDISVSITPTLPTGGSITTGTSPVCAGATGVAYAITGTSYATGYEWGFTALPGATIASGAGTSTITVDFGTGSGIISCTPVNYTATTGCRSTPARTYSVTVSPQVTVNTDPTGATICNGGSHSMSVGYSGGISTTVQWQYFNGSSWVSVIDGIPTGATYTGATGTTLNISGITASGSYNYRAQITDAGTGCNDPASASATLVVQPGVDRGTVDNSGQTICYGGDPGVISMSSAPGGGAGTFNYQWYSRTGTVTCPTGSSTTGWTLLSGETGSTLDPASGLTATTTYAVQVDPTGTPDCGSMQWATNCHVVTVLPNVNYGTVNGTAETICFGGDPANITFSVAPSGGATPPFGYQWYYQDGDFSASCPTPGSGVGSWTAISGATTNSYDPPSGLGATRTYAVRVDPGGSPDCGGEDWSSNCRAVTVVADPAAPTATKSPNVAGVCEGATLTITGVTDMGGGTGTCSITYRYNTGSGYVSTGTTIPSFTAVEGVNTIEVTKSCSGSGCNDGVNTFSWVVAANPTTSNAGPDLGNCASGSFTMAANIPTVGTGAWSVVSGTASVSVPTSNISPVTGVPSGTSATLRWTITSGACPASTDDIVVTNEIAPSAATISGADYTCAGSQFDLIGAAPAVGEGSWSIVSGTGTLNPDLALPAVLRLRDLNGVPVNSSIELRYTVSNGPGSYCPDNTVDTTINFCTELATSADPDITCSPLASGGTQYWASINGEKLYLGLNPNGNNIGATTIELPGSDVFSSPGSYWGGLGDIPNGAYGGGSANPARMPSGKPSCPDELFVEDTYEIDVTNQPTSNDPVLTVYVPKAKWDSFVSNGNTWLDAVAGRRTSYETCYNGFPAVSAAPTTANVAVTGYHSDGRSLHSVSSVVYSGSGDYYAITFTTDRFSGFVIHGSGSGDPLPIQLVSFTGTHINGENVLEWVTASELNTAHFEVERSDNGIDFSRIASVEAAGSSTSIKDYRYIDSDVPSGGHYYRLRIVDTDNSYEYSKVIYLSNGQTVAISQYINVIPNPITDRFEVRFYQAQSGRYTIEITDLAGRPITKLSREGDKGLISVPFDLSAEASGAYLVQVIREDGMRLMRQIIKSTD